MKPLLIFALAGFSLLSGGAPASRAWGCKGHQIVATLAGKHLSPEAQKMVQTLLSENPVDPSLKRFCDPAGLDPLAEASTWADDYREKERSTAPWHFIDIPLSVSPPAKLDPYCGTGGCVTASIARQAALLEEPNRTGTERAMALRFLIHLVGDLHQPLHTSNNNDRGGNCVPVRYFHWKPLARNGAYTPNLHRLWDTELVEDDMTDPDPKAFAATLEAEYSRSFAAWQQQGIRLEAWAWEGHEQAVELVYGALTPRVGIEPFDPGAKSCSDDNQIGERMLAKNLVIGSNYQEEANPVVEQRLAQAGFRLAMILNQAARPRR